MMNKKIISILCIVLMLIMITSCSEINNETETEQTKQATQETFVENYLDESVILGEPDNRVPYNPDIEGYKLLFNGNASFFNVSEIEDLYEVSDCIVEGKPTESFIESEQVRCDMNNNPTEKADDINAAYSYTIRKFKITKVYKGDTDKKEIEVCERAYSVGNDIHIMSGDYIMEKNGKYLLFLKQAANENQHYPLVKTGKYDAKKANNEQNGQISEKMYKQVLKEYSEFFE